MTCYLCTQPIDEQQQINWHHPHYKSLGGIETVPTHEQCHVEYHSRKGDFREWGRKGGEISALSKQWAFNLKGVKDDPLYEQARAFNRAFYAQ